MIYRVILFLVLNFAALGIGAWLMGGGPTSAWYQNLNKAPWTPPGWVFGAAWTTIMICFSVYMAKAYETTDSVKFLLILFSLQWILNVLWNPLFFKYHQVVFSLVIIILLTSLIAYILIFYAKELKIWSVLILPYFVWLLIATSLNAYIYYKN